MRVCCAECFGAGLGTQTVMRKHGPERLVDTRIYRDEFGSSGSLHRYCSRVEGTLVS